MHSPSWFKFQIDVGSALALAGVFFAAITQYNQLQANQVALKAWQDSKEQAYAERRTQVDSHFAAIDARLQPLDSMSYRLGKAETETAAVNTRVDRIVDSFTDQLKDLRKDVNAVGTKVEVLTTTIADQNRRRDQSLGGTRPQE